MSHSINEIYLHVVFVTKYRRRVLNCEILDILKNVFINVLLNFKSELIEFEGEEDHVHLLVKISPTVRICDLIRSLKTSSSSIIMNSNFNCIREKLWLNHLWTPSYYVNSCGNTSIDVVKNYIHSQNRPRT